VACFPHGAAEKQELGQHLMNSPGITLFRAQGLSTHAGVVDDANSDLIGAASVADGPRFLEQEGVGDGEECLIGIDFDRNAVGDDEYGLPGRWRVSQRICIEGKMDVMPVRTSAGHPAGRSVKSARSPVTAMWALECPSIRFRAEITRRATISRSWRENTVIRRCS
jgi:hypothetical protein